MMMDYAPPAAKAVLVLLQFLILAAAMQDAWRLKIANFFPLAVIACFVAWVAIVGPRISLWQNLVAFLLCLSGGLVLFSRNWLGGGDVKLLAAITLWFDLPGAGRLLLYIAIGGGILALVLIGLRRMMPMPAHRGWVAFRKRGPLPYGLAIAAGALLAIHLYGVNPRPLSPMERMQQMGPFRMHVA